MHFVRVKAIICVFLCVLQFTVSCTAPVFEIPKKSGSTRLIHAPTKGLKEFQKALNLILNCV